MSILYFLRKTLEYYLLYTKRRDFVNNIKAKIMTYHVLKSCNFLQIYISFVILICMTILKSNMSIIVTPITLLEFSNDLWSNVQTTISLVLIGIFDRSLNIISFAQKNALLLIITKLKL